jgi:hypothetical protein
MASRFVDFDAALAESEEQPVTLRFQGRDWQLYPALPAKPVLKLMRLEAEGHEEELSRIEMLDLLCSLVPPEAFAAWLDGGLTIDQLAKLLKAIMAIYRAGEGGDEGEAPGPGEGPMPSSSTGAR